jgi:hypothetical protein
MDRAPTNVIAVLLRSSVLRCDVFLSLSSKICCKVSAREICAETTVSIFLCLQYTGKRQISIREDGTMPQKYGNSSGVL